MNKPILGITMGDPAGVGPEITVKALQDPKVYESCKPLVVGDAAILERACRIVGADCRIHPVADPGEGLYEPGTIDILDMGLLRHRKISLSARSARPPGTRLSGMCAKVIELAMDGKVDATCHEPAEQRGHELGEGSHFSGHTEIYAHLHRHRTVHDDAGSSKTCACCARFHPRFPAGSLRPGQEGSGAGGHPASQTRPAGIWASQTPASAVAGLNPHCGEGGLFGREEIDEITPAIEAARSAGINAQGPIPPDTIFSQAFGGWYDIVVSMYHDQGHIPLKTVGFVYDREKQAWKAVEGVNITLGLPIIRTSVDHGTDFYHAGKGNGNELSLVNAIKYAVKMTGRADSVILHPNQFFIFFQREPLHPVRCGGFLSFCACFKKQQISRN